MSASVFERYSAYYDLLYKDKDYVAEAAYIATALRGKNRGVRKVLEFGSGTGRHGRLLAQEGFDVFGVERSSEMVRVAHGTLMASSAAVGSFDCMEGDIRTVHVEGKFDAVISLFHVVSYQTGNRDVLQTFANAARHLPQNGIFLFDVWHGPAVLLERPSVRIKRVEDDYTRVTRIAEPVLDTDASTVTVRYTIFAESKADGRFTTFDEEHRVRYFFPREIEFIAAQSGFTLERREEFLTGKEPSENSWGVAYLLRKTG